MPTPHTPASFYSIKKSAIFYAIMFITILASVEFIDRSLADFIFQHSLSNSWLKMLSNTPQLLEALALIAVTLCIFPKVRQQYKWLALHLAITFTLASVVRVAAKKLFGRTWPQTWVDNNPSWITDRIEGFHPFAEGLAYNSFPSGHALFTFALATTFWYHLPRYRALWIATLCGVFIGQLGQNYHYFGDLLAGATLGTLITLLGMFTIQRVKNIQTTKMPRLKP